METTSCHSQVWRWSAAGTLGISAALHVSENMGRRKSFTLAKTIQVSKKNILKEACMIATLYLVYCNSLCLYTAVVLVEKSFVCMPPKILIDIEVKLRLFVSCCEGWNIQRNNINVKGNTMCYTVPNCYGHFFSGSWWYLMTPAW